MQGFPGPANLLKGGIPRVQFANDHCSCAALNERGDWWLCAHYTDSTRCNSIFFNSSKVKNIWVQWMIMLSYIEMAQEREIYLNFLLEKDMKVPPSIWELKTLHERQNCSNSANLVSKQRCTSLKCSICKVLSKQQNSRLTICCTQLRFEKRDFLSKTKSVQVRNGFVLIWIEALAVTRYN